jgi:hypothetical protein
LNKAVTFVFFLGEHDTAQFEVVWSCCAGGSTGDYLYREPYPYHEKHLGCISFPTNHNIQV